MLQEKNRESEHGQIFWYLAMSIPLLLVFLGLAVDFGLAYITKTTLGKGVDAAALTAMRNYNTGTSQTQAEAEGAAVFSANFKALAGPNLGTVPTLTWSWPSGSGTLTVTASRTLNTYFIRILGSSYNTLTVSASATSTLTPLVMSLVLDKSGSMNYNGGGAALPGAVATFVDYFQNSLIDWAAEVSFSSVAKTDVAMEQDFSSDISASLGSMSFGSATYAEGGLKLGETQITGGPAAAVPNAFRVVVFFTDGWANTNNDTLSCGTVNYGGCSYIEATKVIPSGDGNSGCPGNVWCCGIGFMDPSSGNSVGCGSGTFPIQQPRQPGNANLIVPNAGTPLGAAAFGNGQYDIPVEATWRTEQRASTMRTESGDNITIYAIGMGDVINTAYLQNLANVDATGAAINPNQTLGAYEVASDASGLPAAFAAVEQNIVLRLAQ